jgi:stage IV sporulation protein FB
MITIPGKIPITIQPLFWLLAIFIGWMSSPTITGTLLAMAVVFFSVLFHEFGHALTALVFGQKTRIELAVFGGFTYREGRKLKLWEEFIVVLNGPLAGFMLFLVAYFISKTTTISNPSLAFLLKFTVLANLFWTIINLVPVLPLDGGHLLSIILEGIFGFKGVKMAIIAGLVIGVAISIFFFAIGNFIGGAIFLILIFESFRSLRYYKLYSEKDREPDLQVLTKSAEADFQAGDEEKALKKFEEVRQKTGKGLLYVFATEEMAKILKYQARYKEAYELLKPLQKSLSPEILPLFHYLAFMNQDHKIVTKLSKECFQTSPKGDTALLNALSFGAVGQVEPAIGWLECAIREGGIASLREVLKKKEFDPIRNEKRFQDFASAHH